MIPALKVGWVQEFKVFLRYRVLDHTRFHLITTHATHKNTHLGVLVIWALRGNLWVQVQEGS